jgi:hypothetical protein
MLLRRVQILLPAVALASVLAFSGSAQAFSLASLPTVKSVKPMSAKVGDTLTIKGANFVTGTHKNTVVFLRAGARPVFVRSFRSSPTRITVVIPKQLASYLPTRKGTAVPARFRIRILARRFGRAYTSLRRSPVIAPKTASALPAVDCDKDGKPNGVDTDDDNDLLPDTAEAKLGTDPCNPDTDKDGVPDGFEYASALFLNHQRDISRGTTPEVVTPLDTRPSPEKQPYANPLFADANNDYDGDGLPLWAEYTLWKKYGDTSTLGNMLYNDGTQRSTGDHPATGFETDLNGDGLITDDEKDADHDGLANWVELAGPLSGQQWWSSVFKDEPPYKPEFAGTNFADPDSDGDGILDGADDNDHDGYTNREESDRESGLVHLKYAAHLWVNPFNPCLPNQYSPTCSNHPPVESPWPPFGDLEKYSWLTGKKSS